MSTVIKRPGSSFPFNSDSPRRSAQRGAHLKFKEPPRKRWRDKDRVMERKDRGGNWERNRWETIGKNRDGGVVDAVMRSVAVATRGAKLCWALIYIVPHEGEEGE